MGNEKFKYVLLGDVGSPLNLLNRLNQLEIDEPDTYEVVGTFADNFENQNRYWAIVKKKEGREWIKLKLSFLL